MRRLALMCAASVGASFAQIPAAKLRITTSSLPNATVLAPYSATLTATGGTPPYGWSISSGAIPPGVGLDQQKGTISGTPAQVGSFDFTATVTDSLGSATTAALSITVADPLAITTVSLPNGEVGVVYSAAVAESGGSGSITWSATGLPPGITLNASTGALSGTPAMSGSYSPAVTVMDGVGGSATKTFNVTIAAAVTITTAALPNGTVGVAYSATLAASGGAGSYTWSATGLPPGVSLNASTGVLSGSPTTAGGYNPAVTVTDTSGGTAKKTFNVTIAAAVAITTAALPNGTVGSGYSATLAATGGFGAYTWNATGLPPGINLNASTGALSGTPTTAGTYNPAVTVTDTGGGTATKAFSVTVAAAVAIMTASLPNGTIGVAYSAALAATGGTGSYTWSATGVPPGISLNAATGALSGTPTTAGAFNVAVTVSDASGHTASKTFGVAIAAALAITTTSLPAGTTGAAYSATLAAIGGTPPYSWSLSGGSLPPGLQLGSEGTISGTPSVTGALSFTVRVTDSTGASNAANLQLNVYAPLSITTPSPLPGAAQGSTYSETLQATGGLGPYRWYVTGVLPPGLTLDGSSGRISGQPTSSGQFTFMILVSDTAGQTAAANFSLTIASNLTIASTSPLPAVAVGDVYSYSFAALAGVPPYSWTVSAGTLPNGLALNATTGVLSGTPTAAGTFTFTIRATDSANATFEKQFALMIANALTVSSDSTLPDGSVGVPYSATLAAIAGTSPYTWSNTGGSLPPGLAVAGSGAITGTPTAAGTYQFTAAVRDAAGRTASKTMSITILAALRITTSAQLPPAVVGQTYTQALSAAGGSPPYLWSISTGSLPAGLTLDAASGTIVGTPQSTGVFTFTIQVMDADGLKAQQVSTLQIALQGLPTLQLSGLPATANSLDQPTLSAKLAQPYPVALSGTLTLSFTPDAAVPIDDPTIQFANGSRTLAFTAAAGSTQVTPAATLAFQTGSVAGTITVTAHLTAAGADVTPMPAPAWQVRVNRAAPVIRNSKLVQTTGGFEVWITGLANSRELGSAVFHFTPAAGSNLQTTDVTVPYATAAQQWYMSSASTAFGSQFTIVQPFTVTGATTAVGSVTVTLSNAQGTSAVASAAF